MMNRNDPSSLSTLPSRTEPTAAARLQALEELLSSGVASTQEELREKLNARGFDVTQSTVSRDLRKLGAIRAIDDSGRTVYRIPEEGGVSAPPSLRGSSLGDLVLSIVSNGSIVVIRTTPGSASLIASHLDHAKPAGILGTIAGDDTIFVAPSSVATIDETIEAIRQSFGQVDGRFPRVIR